MRELVHLSINGERYELSIEPNRTLLEVLREEVGLTGTKQSCDMGACGACTVLVNNAPVLSCVTLALACQGKEITTVEGLRRGEQLHPLQSAFIEHGAIQCGMCTPGMLLSAKSLLDAIPHPTVEEVRTAISGNLCRCTGYAKIVEAIVAASEKEEPDRRE